MLVASRLFPIYDKQQAILQSGENILGFVGGRGTGKTHVGAMWVFSRARAGWPCMCVSPSYTVMEETTWTTCVEMARQWGILRKAVKSPTPRIAFRTQDRGEASLVFRSGDNPESLRGPNKAMLWIDEASIQHEDVFNLGVAVLRHKGVMGQTLLTFTPRGKQHWTFTKFFDLDGAATIPRRGTFLVQSHTRENPFAPPDYYDRMAALYSSKLSAQELGGEFVDLEGLMFRREWFPTVLNVPRRCDRVRYWDLAATDDGGDWTVGVLLARDNTTGMFYVEDVQRFQLSPGERNQRIRAVAEADAARYRNEVLIFIEEEPGSGGKEQTYQFKVLLAGFPVYKDRVAGVRKKIVGHEKLPGPAKVVRANPVAAQAETGLMKIRAGRWNDEFLAELEAFPLFANDDQVDALSGAFNRLCLSFGPMGMDSPQRAEGYAAQPQDYGVTLAKPPEADNRYDRPGWFKR